MTPEPNNKTAIDPGLSLPRCIVIVPAHNESKDIAYVISDIQKHSNLPVVVVDDASSDDTIIKARQAGAVVVPLAVQLGAWGATQAGLRYALKMTTPMPSPWMRTASTWRNHFRH